MWFLTICVKYYIDFILLIVIKDVIGYPWFFVIKKILLLSETWFLSPYYINIKRCNFTLHKTLLNLRFHQLLYALLLGNPWQIIIKDLVIVWENKKTKTKSRKQAWEDLDSYSPTQRKIKANEYWFVGSKATPQKH